MSELTNAWGITEDTVSEESSSKFMLPGINEGTFVTKIEFVADPSNSYLLIEMENKDGKTVNRRYFQPKIDGNIVKDAKDLKKSVDTVVKIIANLARKFKGENYVCEGTDFTSLCRNVIAAIGDSYKGKVLRTKVLLNKKNYPVLPAYAPIWEDPTVVTAEHSKLSINDIDKVKRSEQDADTDTSAGTAWTTA